MNALIVSPELSSGSPITPHSKTAGCSISLWHAITGSTEDEEAWTKYGKLIATSKVY
ncbi:MAG: hypothetical protein HWN66_17945 [Candidatus Helarchaeota archaeon]|nr:hypothetical protein [Candidatus Helarchaeota archaeon]